MLCREFSHTVQHHEIEVPADDRCDAEHLVAVLGQPVEPPADHLADALGDRQAPRGHLVRRLEPAVRGEQAHDLVHEERVALGLAVDGPRQGRRRGAPGAQLEEALHVRLPQTP